MAGHRDESSKRDSSKSVRNSDKTDKTVKTDKAIKEKRDKSPVSKSCPKSPDRKHKPCEDDYSCKPCGGPKFCDFKNICSLIPNCIPKGLWCDTMSCFLPVDKVYKVTDELKVRVNLYCNPYTDVVTVNGTPVFGCLDFPPCNISEIIDQVAQGTCSIVCPVTKSLYEKLKTYPELSILVKAINAVDLEIKNYLMDPASTGTLFAPNNAAFEALAAEYGITLEQLLQNPNLANILLNHVVPKVLFSAAFRIGQTVKVLPKSKEFLEVRKSKERPYTVFVKTDDSKSAKVLDADILATNGVIHIIDNVLV